MAGPYVTAKLSAIRSRSLHGIHHALPAGYLRGIDVLGDRLADQIAISCRQFRKAHHRHPDLIAPRTFTEKLLLFKFFGLIPQVQCPSDKLRSVAFAPPSVRLLFRLPARPYITSEARLPDNASVPAGPWYFKSNHGSGTNKRVVFPLSETERAALEHQAQHWLTKVHSDRMSLWWYETMPRNVYLEQDISDSGRDAADWKFFVFNGRVEIFQVDTDRYGDHIQTIYDRLGNFLNSTLYYKSGQAVAMPPDLDVMVRIAEGIGNNFDFIRVDMFRHDGAIYLGEIGLVPLGGGGRIQSLDLDHRLGSAWRAPWLGKVMPGYPGGHYEHLEMSPLE